MQRLWMSLIGGALTLACLLPVPHGEQIAAYNTVSHLAYCDTRSTCLHELAHALDQHAGWISSTPEFSQAVELYLYVEFRRPILTELPARILDATYRSKLDQFSTQRELYAALFQFADGEEHNMPESLRRFYDWDLARTWCNRLQTQRVIYWFF